MSLSTSKEILRKFTHFQPVSVPVHTPVAKPCETTYNKPAQREISEPYSVRRNDTGPITPIVMPIKPQKRPDN